MSFRLSLGIVLLFAICARVEFAWACSCFTPEPRAFLERHAMIFRGTAIRVDDREGLATFAIDKAYKGLNSEEEVTIGFDNRSSCSFVFKVGDKRTVFAYEQVLQDGRFILGTSYCSMVPHLSYPDRFQSALETYVAEITDLTAQVKKAPASISARSRLADAYERAKDYPNAIRELQALEGLVPKDPSPTLRLGQIHLATKRNNAALRAFDSALVIDGSLVPAKNGRDQALLQLGRTREIDLKKRDFEGMSFPKSDFSGRALDKANFSRATVEEAGFANSSLLSADFSESKIKESRFDNAKLIGARFERAEIEKGSFSGADLTRAEFSFAKVSGVNFIAANLSNVNFNDAKVYEANFAGAILRGAQMKGAVLAGSDFEGVDLRGMDFRGHELQGVSFRNANLAGADLSGAMLVGPLKPWRDKESAHGLGRVADFRGADLTGAKLAGADLRFSLFDCKTRWPAGFDISALTLIPVTSSGCAGSPMKTALFSAAAVPRELSTQYGGAERGERGPMITKHKLTGIDLSGANLSGFMFGFADLSKANLRGADLRNATIGGCDLSEANLAGSDLSNARLVASSFSRANLVGAKLVNARIDEAAIRPSDFSGANLSGSDLSGAMLANVNLAGAKLAGARFDAKTRWPVGFDPIAVGAVNVE